MVAMAVFWHTYKKYRYGPQYYYLNAMVGVSTHFLPRMVSAGGAFDLAVITRGKDAKTN